MFPPLKRRIDENEEPNGEDRWGMAVEVNFGQSYLVEESAGSQCSKRDRSKVRRLPGAFFNEYGDECILTASLNPCYHSTPINL